MEAFAYPDGALFAVDSVDVLSRRTSEHVQPATDPHARPISLRVQREEYRLLLTMPQADVPLHVAGTLTLGELVLSATVHAVQPGTSGMIAQAVGVRESFALPDA